MSTTRKSQRLRSEFSSDEEDLAQSIKMEKAKKKSIMTTVDPGKKSHGIDIGKLSDDELRQKILDLGYDPGPIVESTRKVYEKKLKDLLTSESTGDKSPNGTSVNDFDQYSDSEDEAVEITRPQPTAASVHKRIYENNFTTTQSYVSSSEKQIPSKYKSPYSSFTSTPDDIRYPASSNSLSERFSFPKTDYQSSDLRTSSSYRNYDKPFDRSDFTQLGIGRSGIHRDYRSSHNLPVKKKSKKFYIIVCILVFLVIVIFFVYHNLESVQPYEDSPMIG